MQQINYINGKYLITYNLVFIDLTHNYYQFHSPIDLVHINDNKHNKVMENLVNNEIIQQLHII